MVDFEEQIAMALVIGYLKRAKPVSRESFWKAMNDLTDLAVHNIDGFAVEPFFWTMTPQGYPVSDQIQGTPAVSSSRKRARLRSRRYYELQGRSGHSSPSRSSLG